MHLNHKFLQIPGCPSHPLLLILNPSVVDRARDMVIIVVRIETSVIVKKITEPVHVVIQEKFHVGEDDGIVGMNGVPILNVILMVLDGVPVEGPVDRTALRIDFRGENHPHLVHLDVDRPHLVPGTQSVVQHPEGMSLAGICDPALPQNHLLQTPLPITLILSSRQLFRIPKQSSRLRLQVMTRCLDPHR